jgi:hypothetical protein
MRIVDKGTGQEITKDSIPTYLDQLQFYPPEIQSDCPEECKPQYASEIQLVPHYNCIRDAASDWVSDSMQRQVKGPGYLDIESRYRCTCYGAPCGQGGDKRRLYLTESNDCCDRIRCQNNGQLKFNFRNGNVLVVGNQLVLNMNNGQREVIDFDFNLEAMFCNLSDNQIFAQLQSLASQHTSGGDVNEFMNSQDISLDHPSDIQDTRPWYSLIFSRSINGQEVSISIAMDERTCAFDLQVLYGEEIYEHAAPPFISPNTLRDMGISLGDHRTRRFWHRALIVMGQLLRAKEYNVESDYRSAYLNFLSRLKIGVESLQNDPAYAAMHADLANLHALLVEGMTTGDFDLIDEILNALLTVYNQMQG